MSNKSCSRCGQTLGAETAGCICLTCEAAIEETTVLQDNAGSGATLDHKPREAGGARQGAGSTAEDLASRDVDRQDTPLDSVGTGGSHTHPMAGQTNGRNQPLRRFGDYELLSEIARGGMGVVFKARQIKADRTVALKMILKGDLASAADIQRFYAEARAAANLQHSQIVPVYDVGEHEGQHYFAMGYVEGTSLANRVHEGPLPPREAAGLIKAVGEAVAYAHEHGIVHRDLKPANVLVDASGNPLITDFGLAKNRTEDSGLTASGQVLGTPSFMPPEQASGRIEEVGPLADVYSLGATLYHLLTGRPPFLAASLIETLEQVVHKEPVPPSQFNSAIDKDLETICLKCLQKEPSKRYESAQALVADLGRWMDGVPIHARPVGYLERLWRWCKRNPQLATLSATAAALLVLGTVVSSFFAVVAQRREADALQLADSNRKLAESEQRARKDATRAQQESELRLIDMYANAGLQADELHQPAEALLWFSEAAYLSQNDPARQEANRLRFAMWNRLVPQPTRAFQQPGQPSTPRSLSYHPSGKFLMLRTDPGVCTLWDLEREQPLPAAGGNSPVDASAWSPDGNWLVLSGPERGVTVYRFPSGERLHQINFPGTVNDLEFSSDGNLLALAGEGVRVWNCRTLQFATSHLEHPARATHAVFNRVGDKLATAGADQMVRVYRLPPAIQAAEAVGNNSSEPIFPAVPHIDGQHFAERISFPPVFLQQGRILVTRTDWDKVTCWSTENGQPMAVVDGGVRNLFGLDSSPNGRFLAFHGFIGARFWDATTQQFAGAPMRHANFVLGGAFSPDGQAYLTTSGDRTLGLWEVPSGAPLSAPLEHLDSVNLGQFSPDARFMATIQANHLVRIWKRPSGAERTEIPLKFGDCGLTVSPDGRAVFPADWQYARGESNPCVYDIATGTPQSPPLPVNGWINSAAFSPDSQMLVTASSTAEHLEQKHQSGTAELQQQTGLIKFWDWQAARPLFAPVQTPSEPMGVAFDPQGKLVVAVCAAGQILMLDAASGEIVRKLDQEQAFVVGKVHQRIRFAPDGRVFATWLDSTVRLWETDTGKLRGSVNHDSNIYNLSFSRDSQFIATASTDKSARVWRVADGAPAGPALPHPDWVFRATFSYDGSLLVTGAADHLARLWDWRKGELAGPTVKHADQVFEAHLTPNGRWLFTASRDTTMRYWDARTGQPVTPSYSVQGWPMFGEFVPGRNRAIISTGRSLQIIDSPDVTHHQQPLDLEGFHQWGEIISGRKLQERSGMDNLTAAEWLQRWQSFRQAHPDYQNLELDPEEQRRWHAAKGEQCEIQHNVEGTLLHLNRLIELDPDQSQLYRRRCQANLLLQRWDQATADLLRAVDLLTAALQNRPDARLSYQLEQSRLKWVTKANQECPASQENPRPTLILFENQREQPVQLVWIDSNKERHAYGSLQPQERRPQPTYTGHAWLLTDEQDVELGHFIAGEQPAQAVIPSQ